MRGKALIAVAAALAAGSASAGAAAGPPPVGIVAGATGAALYAANCSSCHGPHGEGVPPPGRAGVGDLLGFGPSLRRAGALAADFYLRTGYMPLSNPREQPTRSAVLFSERQIRELVAYVAQLGSGPAVPRPHPSRGSLSDGFGLFSEHCAGCHQTAGEGGYVTGARVPPLSQATPTQVAEAVRIGPYLMPTFSQRALSDGQLDSIIRYVVYLRHESDPGGWSLGRTGPIPEGLVAWLIATATLVATCVLLSRRLRRGGAP